MSTTRPLHALVAVLLFAALAAADGLVAKERSSALSSSIPGTWSTEVGKERLQLLLRPGGTFELGARSGSWRVDGSTLVLATRGDTARYAVDATPDLLTLSGGDLTGPVKFSRMADVGAVWGRLARIFRVSRATATTKAQRIVVIVLIIVLARVVIWLLRHLSHLLIYSEWGPLRFVYRTNKKRRQTLHSLGLNVLKYVVYFAALGYVLTELGVNYTAYLASLSVVGLAIGFGSQGLVQDLVTGFFIIFEGQFDVGDMVEISGQTGIVEDLGLRMTRLRNYHGQTVVIPNRNIAIVGTYRHGGMCATVTVACAEPGSDQARAAAESVLSTVASAFPGVIRPEQPGATRPACRIDGGLLHVGVVFWPGQQWVIEQHVVPRLAEALDSASATGASPIVWYHSGREAQ